MSIYTERNVVLSNRFAFIDYELFSDALDFRVEIKKNVHD